VSIFVTDIGYTKVGDHWGKSLGDLAYDASKGILKRAKRKPNALVVANSLAEISSSQGNLGSVVADALQITGIPAYRLEAAGASGGAAMNFAFNLLKSGAAESVLVLGVEKMRDLDPMRVMLAQGLSENADYTQFFGISFAATNALLARTYMHEHNISRELLSAFPVICHRNSSTAEHAQFKRKFSAEEVSKSEIVADPLRVLDCAPVGDGAAAILLESRPESGADKKRPVEFVASECATGTVNFFERENVLGFGATREAAGRALAKGQISIKDVDFLEIHDSYSELAALSVEALGLSEPGMACIDASKGRYDLSGRFPISTFGGMKGRGYPIGAVGLYQVCEAYLQLSEQAGFNQVADAEYGLVQNMSGIDSCCFVHLLRSTKKPASS
jgi:acetyl-CoA C-acetyltransferase